MDSATLISITAIVVSGAVGLSGVFLNYRKFTGSEALERAARRTEALQMLSDEECTLMAVEVECWSISQRIDAEKVMIGEGFQKLKSEAERIRSEAKVLLKTVRTKRINIKERILALSAPEIETIIAEAYHGKKMAEAQLNRTSRSVEEAIRLYLSK